MRLLFELSGEHPTLPAAEALALLALRGPHKELERDEGLLVAEAQGDGIEAMARRLGLTHRVSEGLAEAPLAAEAIVQAVEGIGPRVGMAFRVRAHRVGAHGRDLLPSALERAAGAALAHGRRVEFEGPADEVRILLGRRAHVGLLVTAVDRSLYDARHVRFRPFFSPVSLHPRFARALVNLARVRPGDRVADPFAGTGGLLVEAGLVGARVTGADLDPDMVDGAREVLRHFDLGGEVLEGDVADTLPRMAPLDAVVSDPPYGRGSSTAGEPRAGLHRRALEAMRDAVRPGGRVAVVLPDPAAALPPPEGLVLEQRHVQRVHRSLDRHYLVFVRA